MSDWKKNAIADFEKLLQSILANQTEVFEVLKICC